MRKQEQHSVMVKNLCVSVCKIDTERERDRHKEYVIFKEATVTK